MFQRYIHQEVGETAFKLNEEYELPELQSRRQSVESVESVDSMEDDKDLDFFINTIERDLKRQTPINYIPIVNPKHLQQTCLDIASRDGKTKFVRQLLQQGVKPNIVNKTHNRAPIHFATEGGHVATLAILLNESTINPNLEAGKQTALHIAVNKCSIKCATLLLEKGASASIPDSMGLTALHLAAMKQQQEMTKLILKKCRLQPDLDRYKDHNGKTTRQVIKQLLPELTLRVDQEITLNDLKHYLSINDETNFLKNIKFYEPNIFSVGPKCLLEMAVQRNFYKAVCKILNAFKFSCYLNDVARVAVQRDYYNIFQKILNTYAENLEFDSLLLDTCMELGKPKINSITDCLKCLKAILEKKNVNVRFCDVKGNTPLHYAAKAGCNEAVNLLLHRGSHIGHMNSFNEPPIASISASELSSFFDECIQSRNEWTKEYTIEFNYRCLMPHKIVRECILFDVNREMEVFEYISHYDHLKQLLKHPLLSSFLYLKWQKIQHFLHANFIFYMTFYIMLNAYIFNNFLFENRKQIVNNSTKIDLKNSSQVVDYICYDNSTLRILIIMLLLLIILWEVLQFICRPQRYLADLEKWLQFVLIALSLVLLFDMRFQTMTIMTIIQNVLILLSAWKIVILLSQYPYMSTAVEMFRMVFLNFIRFLIPYVIIIFAFALVFHMLFKDKKDNNFYDPIHSLFKTVIMFTGEFDLNGIPFDTYPIWSRIVFQLFVFLITIVLFNLVNGLAVNDITEIMSKAELVGLIARIRLLAYFEDLITMKPWFLRSYDDVYPLIKFACEILLFPHSQSNGKISFKPYNKNYVRSDFKSNIDQWSQKEHDDKFWATMKLDPNIIKQVERIISNKKQLADNKAIMIALNNIKKELEDLKIAFNLTEI